MKWDIDKKIGMNQHEDENFFLKKDISLIQKIQCFSMIFGNY